MLYLSNIHTDMHIDMHRIQTSSYRICTVHIAYIQSCISLYLLVSVCITSSKELYPVHMCMYVGYIQPTYRQIHTDMHSWGEFISACICLYLCPEYMQICTPAFSAYLYVSVCILILDTCIIVMRPAVSFGRQSSYAHTTGTRVPAHICQCIRESNP